MVWQWAWKQTWRDWRAGQLRLLALALWLAVAAVTSVGFLSQRVQLGFERDARALLGGDLALSADQSLPPDFAQEAARLGLKVSQTLDFPSVARAPQDKGGQVRLVSLKAVDAAWPLRGAAKVTPAPGEPAGRARPAPGTAWVDPDVLPALGLKLGDRLLLGDSTLRISHTLVSEPDRGGQLAFFTPRVLINSADIAATGLVQPASRVRYRLAVAAPQFEANPPAVERFGAWASKEIKRTGLRGVRTETLEDGNPQMRRTLERAGLFLRLVSLLAALLCAVAVAVVSRDFARQQLDTCALLRVLGQPQRRIATLYALEFFIIGVLASGAGVLAGWALHGVFVQLLTGLIDAQLPAPGVQPALVGGLLGLSLMVAFGLPPVLRLAQVSPLRVLRRDLGAPGWPAMGVLLLGGLGVGALLWGVAGDARLGSWVIGGFVAALALFAAVAYAVVWGLQKLLARVGDTPRPALQTLRLTVRQMASRPGLLTLQVAALSVGLTALVLLVILRTDLIQQWQDSAPADAPNRFVINIQPDQAQTFQQQIRTEGVGPYDWSPMVRGRLVSINATPVNAEKFEDPDARRMVEREFNLSYTPAIPPHNILEEGQWRPGPQSADGVAPGQTPVISVESGLMQRLGLKLGDTLHFDVAGQMLSARISSTRKVDWASMRVNFFVLFPYRTLQADAPGAAVPGAPVMAGDSGLPATWISAFHAPADPAFDARMMQRFPNITLMNIEQTLQQVRAVLNQVVRAVELLFVFSLAAGLVVLVATMASTRQERLRDLALMRALGASRALLGRMQRLELLALGALAGVLASVCANAVAWGLATQVFSFENWTPAWTTSLVAVLGASLLCVAVGGWQLRGVVHASVTQTLRNAGAG
ncbi:ABC transporter permease [Amphibiibacter pelophylacis]|uniref:FtsX-like permease family protein n=1 Tax=Amphibiibacter pelophylacis TaxID=1799477 RepID=A0ACC6P603_9BURK